MAVEQGRGQRFLKPANLAADGGLAQIQPVTRMGQTAGVCHGMKYS